MAVAFSDDNAGTERILTNLAEMREQLSERDLEFIVNHPQGDAIIATVMRHGFKAAFPAGAPARPVA